MLLSNFITLIKTVDPLITKNQGNGEVNYTTWSTGSAQNLMSDNQAEDSVQRIYVDRFTLDGDEEFPKLMNELLDNNFISFEDIHDYDETTKYYHHSFTCYVGQPEELED